MKTGKDLKDIAINLFDSAMGDEFEFMLKIECQPEFSNLTQAQRDMVFLFSKQVKTE